MSQGGIKSKKMTFNEYESKLSKNNLTNKTKRKVQNPKVIENKHQYEQKKFAPNPSSGQIIPTSSKIQDISQILPTSSLSHAVVNHKQIHQNSLENISIPLTHYLNDQAQNSSEQPSKLDLIFQKQPQEVQRKLRQLLLNYNAVMQYNQNQDKFQVDLLLPFNSMQERETFVQKFTKTRKYLNSQIESSKQQYKNHQKNQDNENKQLQSVSQKNQFINDSPQNNISNHDYIQEEKQHADDQNVLSVSLRQESQKVQQQKQRKQRLNRIDYNALSLSLDSSIKKALLKIKKSKKPSQQILANQKNQHLEKSQSIQAEQSMTQQKQTNQINKYQQGQSQIESQISQGVYANVPNQLNRNILNTPSGYDKNKGKQRNSANSFDQKNQFSKPNIYQSPIVPFKHSNTNEILQKSNESSNEILIEDQIPYDQFQNYQNQNQHDNNFGRSKTYQNSYNSHDNSYDYNSAFDMIEETAQQHQEERFPSPKEYQKFLKKQLNTTAKNMKMQSFNNTSSFSNNLANSTQNYDSTSKYGSSSSLRKRYADFLKSNHKKIESLYQRIGKQIKKNERKKSDVSKFNSQYQSTSSKDQSNQILAFQDSEYDSRDEKQSKLAHEKQSQQEMLEQYKKRIVLQNESMSSEDKVRYFRYLARHAKVLYLEYIKNKKIKM